MTRKHRISRREFAKLAGGTALLAPTAIGALDSSAAARAETAATQQPPAAGSQLKLTAEQEERVKQARERTERTMRGLRERAMAYDAEPAFTFRARTATKNKA